MAANTTLTNTSLAVTGLPTLTLSGITTANLTDTAGGNTFTVSGWTGSGLLTDSAATGDTVTASKSAGFTLTNTLALLDRRHDARLERDSRPPTSPTPATRQHLHRHRLDGSGTLKGSTETLVDSVSSSVVLAKTSLAVTGGPTLTLSGFTTANLTDTTGGNTFTVSGWTGSGSLTDSASISDTVAASKSAGYTLANTSLSSTDGMALDLSGITTANLAATSASKTFTVSGWTGSGSLTDTATGIVTASKSAGFTLTNTSLSSTDGMTLGLSGITTANLTDTRFGRQHLHHHRLDREGHADRHARHSGGHGDGEHDIDQQLSGGDWTADLDTERVHDRQPHRLSRRQHLYGQRLDRAGLLTDSAATGDTVTASKSAGFTLANSLALLHRWHDARLERVHNRQPHRHRQQRNTFTITGWTGSGTLKGTAETLVDSVSGGVRPGECVTGGDRAAHVDLERVQIGQLD